MSHHVECLRCGALRSVSERDARGGGDGECPRCKYVGWAPTDELSEAERGLLRLRPPERRRFHAV